MASKKEQGWRDVDPENPPVGKWYFYHPPQKNRHGQTTLGPWLRVGTFGETPNRPATKYHVMPDAPKDTP